MTAFRAIPIQVHAALEFVAAPLLIVAPFVLGFSVAAGAMSIALGVLLIGLAATVYDGQDGRGALPLSAHAGFDYALAAVAITLGVAALAVNDFAAGIFLLAFGSAHLGLIVSTRYSRPLGA